MPLKTDAVGKTWGPVTFAVEAERIAKYADAIGADSPIHRDAEAAREAGFRDVVAPPMFCVVYSGPAMGPAIFDPEVEMNFAAMVHGGQEFEWGEPVCAGDQISTTVRCASIEERDGKGFYVFESVSENQEGQQTVKGTWTDIVRGIG
jgi:acyl dehydratase